MQVFPMVKKNTLKCSSITEKSQRPNKIEYGYNYKED